MEHYSLSLTITKHVKPVCFAAFSGSGELLATGDDDGHVFIWSLATGQLFQSLTKCEKEAVSGCWGDDKEIFVGSGNGELHFFEHVSTHNRFHRSQQFYVDRTRRHIASTAVHSNRVACCSGNTIHCYRIEGSSLHKLFSWDMDGAREIRTVHFLDRNTLLATALREGECVLLDIMEPTKPLWRRALRHRIGESALSPDGKNLAVTTLASSVRIYGVSSTGLNLLHDLPAPNRLASNFPLQVCFAESQALVVAGSDSGEIRSWDLASQRMGTLQHSAEADQDSAEGGIKRLYLTQVVAAKSTCDHHLIASACSEPSKVTVKVWRKPLQVNQEHQMNPYLALVIVLAAILAATSQLLPTYESTVSQRLSSMSSWYTYGNRAQSPGFQGRAPLQDIPVSTNLDNGEATEGII